MNLVFLHNFGEICSASRNMGLDTSKPVFGDLRTTRAQTSLRIRAVVVGHRLEIIIDHRSESVVAVDAIF